MTHYVGGIIEKVAGAGVTKWRQYIPTPLGRMVLISRDPNATGAILYVVSDHLGSSDTLLDQTGAMKPKLSFDVFVARRGGDWITTTAPDCTNVASTTRAASQLALGQVLLGLVFQGTSARTGDGTCAVRKLGGNP